MTFTSTLARFNAKTVLLFGSSAVAASLVQRLVRAGARVRWFSRDVDVAEELWLSGEPNQIELAFRQPRAIDFEEAAAVFAAIGEPVVFRLYEQTHAADCPFAVLGRPELSTFDLDEGRGEDSQRHELGTPRPNTTARGPASWLAAHVKRAGQLLSSLACSLAF